MRSFSKLLLFVTAPFAVWGQCAVTYSDGSADGSGNTPASTFYAWASVTDYYNGQCSPPWSGFTHSYHVSVSIVSPQGRTATSYNSSYQNGGGGTATANTNILIIEDGTYQLIEQETIDCSVAGAGFFSSSLSNPFFASGKVRTVYGFDSSFGGCSYHKSCGPSTNHWAGDTYTSMPFNKGANSCWNYVSKFHRFVKVGPVKRYWAITDDMGNSYVGHDGWLECDGPMPY